MSGKRLKLPFGYVPKTQSLLSSYFSPKKGDGSQSQSSSQDDEGSAPSTNNTPTKMQIGSSTPDDEEEEEQMPVKKAATKRPRQVMEEETKIATPPPKRAATRSKQQTQEILVDDEENEEEEDAQPTKKKRRLKKIDEVQSKPKPKPKPAQAKKPPAKKKKKDDDDEDYQQGEEEEGEEEEYLEKGREKMEEDETVNGDEGESELGQAISGDAPSAVGEGGVMTKKFTPNPKRHQEFVKKLMKLDTIQQSQKEATSSLPTAAAEAAALGPQKGRSKAKGVKYTPLEMQVLAVKAKHPDAILLVECGYRYRFFGEDAEIASKVLNIVAFPSHNFMTASVPTHRLFIHVRRLVEAGHKVGVVKQTETAAIKATGSNKSQPFTRELSALYTKATFIPTDMDSTEVGASNPNYLMCIYEKPATRNDKAHFSIVAVQLQTGDIVYDDFEDDYSRENLETRIIHLRPSEVLIPASLTHATEKLINRLCPDNGPNKARKEKKDDHEWDYDSALMTVSEFYGGVGSSSGGGEGQEEEEEGEAEGGSTAAAGSPALAKVLALPNPVVICLGVLVGHLNSYGLDSALHLTGNFRHFTSETVMTLPGTTLKNLELFLNSDTYETKGSLFWLINRTATAFGARLLRKWLEQPLVDRKAIENRLDAVTELMDVESKTSLAVLLGTVHQIPDLERGLTQCHYQKCSPQAFVTLLQAFQKLVEVLPDSTAIDNEIQSPYLKELFQSIPDISADVQDFLSNIDHNAAAEGNKMDLFGETGKFPEVSACKEQIKAVTVKLQEHLVELRKTFKKPSLHYVSVNNTEYQVEFPRAQKVPNDWVQLTSTKAVARYHTPYIVTQLQKMAVAKEKLQIAVDDAWQSFLSEFKDKYEKFHKVMRVVAIFDCLNSLAIVARTKEGYVRPKIVDNEQLIIREGRHPVVETIMGDAGETFVPNSVVMGGGSSDKEGREKVMILTGPNMGGKTSFIKQAALIVIMAQIGSYVPAGSVTLHPFDAIYTRMGATDDIQKGQSTFFVELAETSSILHKATSRSLVILDELGRGTSTHDGVAIAYATLDHIVNQIGCFTFFVTHYPILAQLEHTYPDKVGNYHMAFFEEEKPAATKEKEKEKEKEKDNGHDTSMMDMDEEEQLKGALPNVTFLYKLKRGAAKRSYGLNVARLAEVPTEVLIEASRRSRELERVMSKKQQQREISRRAKELLLKLQEENPEGEEREAILSELVELQQKVKKEFSEIEID